MSGGGRLLLGAPEPMTRTQPRGDGAGRPGIGGAGLLVPVLSVRPSTVLITGYPAPAAVALVERLLARGDRLVVCLVAPEGRGEAARCAAAVERGRARLRLLAGAVAEPGLGLGRAARPLLDAVEEIFHYAPAGPGPDVSGDGRLSHLLDFAEECPRLRRLHGVGPGAGSLLRAAAAHGLPVATDGATDVDAAPSPEGPAPSARALPAPRSLRALRLLRQLGRTARVLVGVPPALLAWARTIGTFDFDVAGFLTERDVQLDLDAGLAL